MQRNAGKDDKILVRMVSLDDYEEVIDFEGRTLATRVVQIEGYLELDYELIFT